MHIDSHQYYCQQYNTDIEKILLQMMWNLP